MASVSLPTPHQWPSVSQLHPYHAYGSSQPAAHLPNPPFTFPAQNPEPVQLSRMTSSEAAPLPAFSFPQAPEPGSPSDPATTTAVSSPQRPKSSPHRRRGSELAVVGGENNAANNVEANDPAPALPSPAPGLLPEPGPGLSGQSPGRRRHRHQRSSAISSVDLSAVTKAFPPAPATGGSAPVTPADMKHQHTLNNETAQSTSRTFPSTSPRSPPLPSPRTPKDSQPVPSPASPPSAAAAFPPCDSPLPTASSEHAPSTLKPTHAQADSSSPQVESDQRTSSTVRPKTAGEMIGLTGKRRSTFRGTEGHKRPLSFSSSASKPGPSGGSTRAPDVPPLPKSLLLKATSRNGSSGKRDKPSEETTKTSESADQPDSEDKPPGKKKKVRSWAGKLTRKARRHTRKKPSRKTPTPPPILTRTNSEVGSASGVDFDTDNTVVIRSPGLPNVQSTPAQLPVEASTDDRPSLETSWKPQSFYEQGQEPDLFSPVIDLDAALGPFNTPDMASETEPQESGFSVATKRMYSGGRRGQFVGPEMRYHRRTESAPVMPPFERPTSCATRLSGMPMVNPDVFDEEEEDAFLAGNDSSHPAGDETKSLQDADDDDKDNDNDNDNDSEAGLGIQIVDEAERPSSVGPATRESMSSSPRTIVAEDCDHPNESVCRDSEFIANSDESPEAPAHRGVMPSAQDSPSWVTENRPATSPDLQGPKFGFPDPGAPSADSEKGSLDVPRLATASSSISGRQPLSNNGEFGRDGMHGSTEDVPSLTSTTSTATGTTPRMSFNFSRAKGDQSRPPPATADAGVRRSSPFSSKRSSIVSLTKLVGGSLGPEKSKLCYEEKAPGNDGEETPAKSTKKKTRHFSRLMHFWKEKGKEKERARTKDCR